MTANARDGALTHLLEAEPSFETLYGQYHQFVRRALRKHYVEAHELDDMTQEVFLVLLRRVDEAGEKRSLGAWLYQIARRVAANHHRGQRRRERKHDDLGNTSRTAMRPAGTLDPEERVAREEAWSFVRDFVEALDEEACAVFVMSEIEGLKGAEVAARLGLSLPMAYARIRNVRERFGRELARDGRAGFGALAIPFLEPLAVVVVRAAGVGTRAKAAALVLAMVLFTLLGWRWFGGDGQSPIAGPQDERDGSGLRNGASGPSEGGDDAGPDTRGLLAPGSTFGGVVVSEAGDGIPGALVCADRLSDDSSSMTSPPECVTTDDAGAFEITGQLKLVHDLHASAYGFVPGRHHGVPSNSVRIVLHSGGTELSGVVLDVFGGPVEGAWVSVENEINESLGATVVSDAEGRFSLWVKEGSVSLGAGAKGYATSYTMAWAPSTEVRLRLGAESAIAGIVVDAETGKPMQGVRVFAGLHPTADKYANRQGMTHSDADGRFEIDGLQPAHYTIDGMLGSSWGRAREAVILGIADRREDIRVEMNAGTSIAGRVVDDESGDPCLDGLVVAFDEAQSLHRGGRVRADGLASVDGLSGGVLYFVTVTCRGYLPGFYEVDLRAGPVGPQTWKLSRGSELAVSVLDQQGAPISDWDVELLIPPEGPGLSEKTARRRSDSKGRALFSGLTPGLYKVTARGDGHPAVTETKAQVNEGHSEVELRAGQGVVVGGQVLDSGGAPVRGALVVLRSKDAEQLAREGGPARAISDATGRFLIASVGAGDYGVWVLPGREASLHLRPAQFPNVFGPDARPGKSMVDVVVGAQDVELKLRTEALTTISGVVRDQDGDVLADTRVFAAREIDGRARPPRGTPTLTDPHGKFEVEGLASGIYEVSAYKPGGGLVREGGVKAGATGVELVLPRLGSIAGTVKSPEGEPLRAYPVMIEGDNAPEEAFFPVGSADGGFIINALEAGHYRVRVAVPQGVAETEVDLGPGQHLTGIDLTLEAPTNVQGRLVDPQGKPLAMWQIIAADPMAKRKTQQPMVYAGMRTEADGRFELRALPDMELAVLVRPWPEAPPVDMASLLRELLAWPDLMVIKPPRGEVTDLGDVVVGELP